MFSKIKNLFTNFSVIFIQRKLLCTPFSCPSLSKRPPLQLPLLHNRHITAQFHPPLSSLNNTKNCNFWNIVYSNMNRFLKGFKLQTNANELDIELFWGLKLTMLVIYKIFDYICT